MPPLKVAFIGPAAVGKDTTLFGVSYRLKTKGYNVDIVPEIAREAYYKGFKLDTKADINGVLWMLGKQIEKEANYMRGSADVLLVNRSIFDGLVYSKFSLPNREFAKYTDVIWSLSSINIYDEIFYLNTPYRKYIADGIRPPYDPCYQQTIKEEFDCVTSMLSKTPHVPITVIPETSLKKRTNKIVKVIEERVSQNRFLNTTST